MRSVDYEKSRIYETRAEATDWRESVEELETFTLTAITYKRQAESRSVVYRLEVSISVG